jgi:hypothetical protein
MGPPIAIDPVNGSIFFVSGTVGTPPFQAVISRLDIANWRRVAVTRVDAPQAIVVDQKTGRVFVGYGQNPGSVATGAISSGLVWQVLKPANLVKIG